MNYLCDDQYINLQTEEILDIALDEYPCLLTHSELPITDEILVEIYT